MTQRGKMSVENRAKQFMPFSALPGLDEALARVEEEVEMTKGSGSAPKPFGNSMSDISSSADRYEELYEEDQ